MAILERTGALLSSATALILLAGCKDQPAGGVWGAETPQEGSVITETSVDLSAHGYPTSENDPPIDYTDFTLFYPGVGDTWPIACRDEEPDEGTNIYRCKADLTNVPPGEVTITFNVCNVEGECNLAPHGERHIVYEPED